MQIVRWRNQLNLPKDPIKLITQKEKKTSFPPKRILPSPIYTPKAFSTSKLIPKLHGHTSQKGDKFDSFAKFEVSMRRFIKQLEQTKNYNFKPKIILPPVFKKLIEAKPVRIAPLLNQLGFATKNEIITENIAVRQKIIPFRLKKRITRNLKFYYKERLNTLILLKKYTKSVRNSQNKIKKYVELYRERYQREMNTIIRLFKKKAYRITGTLSGKKRKRSARYMKRVAKRLYKKLKKIFETASQQFKLKAQSNRNNVNRILKKVIHKYTKYNRIKEPKQLIELLTKKIWSTIQTKNRSLYRNYYIEKGNNVVFHGSTGAATYHGRGKLSRLALRGLGTRASMVVRNLK